MESRKKPGRDGQTLVTVLQEEAVGRAFDEMEAQRVRAPELLIFTEGPVTETAKPGPLLALPAAEISNGPPQIQSPHSTDASLA